MLFQSVFLGTYRLVLVKVTSKGDPSAVRPMP